MPISSNFLIKLAIPFGKYLFVHFCLCGQVTSSRVCYYITAYLQWALEWYSTSLTSQICAIFFDRVRIFFNFENLCHVPSLPIFMSQCNFLKLEIGSLDNSGDNELLLKNPISNLFSSFSLKIAFIFSFLSS